MKKDRMVAFTDGVFAVIITIMVLDLKIPHEATFEALRPIANTFLAYVLSFTYIGIYWNNHHHMLTLADETNGGILWANLHLLFWLSLVPFATGWVGEGRVAGPPVATYATVLLMAGLAYTILQSRIIKHHGKGAGLGRAIGGDLKGKVSLVFYVAAIATSFVFPLASVVLCSVPAIFWFIPDRRIEGRLGDG
ncbi:MAG: TMEM175 family protein [Fimbriimonadaceae bacterium]